MHPILAIRAFFAALFGRTLPPELFPAALLEASRPQLPEPAPRIPDPVETAPTTRPEPAPPAPEPPKGPSPEAIAVKTLAILQQEGRLIDFLFESIDDYSDADIGGAVREVHRGCKKALEDHFQLTPVREEEEDALVTVPAGFDPASVRLVGNVVGKPPFSGTLKHRGWRAAHVRLPRITEDDGLVVAPAEVEI